MKTYEVKNNNGESIAVFLSDEDIPEGMYEISEATEDNAGGGPDPIEPGK